ncbi:4-(cytidine 5'-diphospho)-2-C-methyl-D-erythritol kinase [Natronospira bacteriovora]|uniref:4-diphosphocytidyl-2-C-methyl-D-erythritol kinase n=1 Tax=Natronospira bacteriovora TaxID=3069753 RepID=A0ABU0W3Z3_9GAMM|nr:4-(cytidine 5'-diphospho)-2-C-methyl-D-erythritol kinase [Natronospira sp. AB-CW4]MDQ2068737.1 4-(cytidine 5'-diphospho)-2-C-methyl-D-erythritol kinase [Natronospira sp. AB-CW4]
MTALYQPAAGTWPAPAKLNLFLHVTGRREDGFHDLQTLFQFLDWGDQLRFELRDDGVLQRRGGLVDVPESDDLVIRAADALRRAAGRPALGAVVELDKKIPSQAGLGGGSSDAATVLVALNHLWGLAFSPSRLARIGLTLGADVPVFVRGRAAWAEGRGERLSEVDLPEPWYLVVRPDCAIATGALFAHPELRRDSPAIAMEDFLAGRSRNDFQPIARALHPPVAEALEWLSDLGEARLTGTGSCVFVALASRAAGETALKTLPGRWQAWLARGRNRSPLLDALAEQAG